MMCQQCADKVNKLEKEIDEAWAKLSHGVMLLQNEYEDLKDRKREEQSKIFPNCPEYKKKGDV